MVEDFERRVIGDVDEWESDVIKTLLELPRGGECVFYIDSAGGSVFGALAVLTLLRHRQLAATAIVLGECSSAALLLFAACRRRFVRKPRTYFLDPGVGYFVAYAASTESRSRSERTGTARTRTTREPTWIAPCGSSRNVRYQPSGLSDHDRPNTRPSITIGQMPMKRWDERAPARTPRMWLASIAATIARGSLWVTYGPGGLAAAVDW